MNRFAQVMYGEVIYIFEADLKITDLPSIFSPKQYWFDVTNTDCEVGYVVDTSDGKLKFRKPNSDEVLDAQARSTKSELQDQVLSGMVSQMLGQDISNNINTYKASLKALSDDVARRVPEMFPAWSPNSISYKKDDRVSYNGILYKVLSDHTSQDSWKPTEAPSLFSKVLTSSDGTPKEWEQPDSTNPYMKGDKVIYKGKIYESVIDSNVWSPEGFPAGWKEITNG